MMSFFTFPSQNTNVSSGAMQNLNGDQLRSEEWWTMACQHARYCIPGYPCCHPPAIHMLLMPSGPLPDPYVPVGPSMFPPSYPFLSHAGTAHNNNFGRASSTCSLSPMVRSDSSHLDDRSMCASADINERNVDFPRVHSMDSVQQKVWHYETSQSNFLSPTTHQNLPAAQRNSPKITTRDDGVLVVKIPPFRPIESPLASPMTQDVWRPPQSQSSSGERERISQSDEMTIKDEQPFDADGYFGQHSCGSASTVSFDQTDAAEREHFTFDHKSPAPFAESSGRQTGGANEQICEGLVQLEEADRKVMEDVKGGKGKRISQDPDSCGFIDVVAAGDNGNSQSNIPSTPSTPTAYCCQKHRHRQMSSSDSRGVLLRWDCVGSVTANGYQIPYWAVNMNVREFEMRMQLANLQERYREKQRELAMLRCSKRPAKRCAAISTDSAPPVHKRHSHSHRSNSSLSMKRKRSVSLCSAELVGDRSELKLKISFDRKRPAANDASVKQAPSAKTAKISEKRPDPGAAARLTADKLVDGTRLLYLENGLLYPGTLKVIEPPDVYGLEFGGVGDSDPYILCEEELLKKAVVEVKLKETDSIEAGLRICGPWRGRETALYPGVVEKEDEGSQGQRQGTSSSAERNPLIVDFDDGDSGIVSFSEIRLLPSDYPPTRVTSSVLPEFLCRRNCAKESRRPRHKTPKRLGPTKNADKSHSLIWKWKEKAPTRANASKSKTGKIFYNSVRKGTQLVKVGDCVSFRATNLDSKSYVGVVQKMWEFRGTKYLRVSWCYRIDEVLDKYGKKPNVPFPDFALFRSSHVDDNLVDTIECGCELLSFKQFAKQHRLKSTDTEEPSVHTGLEVQFYDAGVYDPVSRKIEVNPKVKNLG